MTRIHVVSDVHGRADALARAGDGADALVVLGDLLLYLDYADPTQGILADLLGAEAGAEFAEMRKEHRFGDLRSVGARLMSDPAGLSAAITEAAKAQYAELFDVMPTPAYCTYGNVDMPKLWPEFVDDKRRMFDAEVVEIGGWRFGFVGGWPRKVLPAAQPRRTTGARPPIVQFGADFSPEEYAAKVAALGPVDVLCSHVPPAVPELRWDTVTRRPEVASEALLNAIEQHQPRYALFGHVHQPLQHRLRIGRTECVNVGHFRATGEPFVLEW
ncbi:metallophosphoesterase family protein [Cryptosporangium aurantiacum]|uniref:Predicted phosphoesterase n=1 Tax=Cryptosporangium aurantiacum TaxID=134849 RepID=A0A1M7R7D7_9ACTN|nr:metallophosphoesterase [Cryptosporangium aurantiacum]SHN42245.1 Predicted phosphoesterase [Cryptosporangium aurantiacum]